MRLAAWSATHRYPPLTSRPYSFAASSHAKWVHLAVGEELGRVLAVRPRHEVIVAARDDLGRRGDGREQIVQHRVLLGVGPHKPRRLGEALEVVGADVVLVDLRLADARGGRLDCVTDIRSGVEGAHVIQSRRFGDLLEGAARVDREADRAAADGQARDPFRSLRSEEKRGGRANVRADDVRNSQAPFIDQVAKLPPGCWGQDSRFQSGGRYWGSEDRRRIRGPGPPPGAGTSPYPPIADYGFLSDCEANCLIASSGQVECCLLYTSDAADE